MLQSIESQRVRQDLRTEQQQQIIIISRGSRVHLETLQKRAGRDTLEKALQRLPE